MSGRLGRTSAFSNYDRSFITDGVFTHRGCPVAASTARGAGFVRTIERAAGAIVFTFLGLIAVRIVLDQIALLPPKPPTKAQSAAARPWALACWHALYPKLAARLPAGSAPLEFGKVWATRTGRLCGLVNRREERVDDMVPFYTLNGRPMLQDDDVFTYFQIWPRCAFDEWVVLHPGTTYTGFCASARGRRSHFGRGKCIDWLLTKRPVAP
jgi:hypothetical protein